MLDFPKVFSSTSSDEATMTRLSVRSLNCLGFMVYCRGVSGVYGLESSCLDSESVVPMETNSASSSSRASLTSPVLLFVFSSANQFFLAFSPLYF